MQVEIGNCSGGNDYIAIETTWLNIMGADWKDRYDNRFKDYEGYCNVNMIIQEKDLDKLKKDCIIDLIILDNTGETLLVTFFTCDDINIKE